MNSSSTHARGANLTAIAEATGLGWDDWVEWLDAAGGRGLQVHAEIAALALERILDPRTPACSNPQWWAQAVTVAYEQHIGRRLPGQRPDGTFDANASRTVAGTMDEAIDRVAGLLGTVLHEGPAGHQGPGALDGVEVVDGPTVSATEKWRYWRAGLADGSRVDVTVNEKPRGSDGAAKSAVAVGHRRIVSPDAAAQWKAFWRQVLGRL